MTDQLLDTVRVTLEGQIDFEGQRLADLLTTILLTAAGVVAFVLGIYWHDIYTSLFTGLVGTALAFLVVVPPWPFFKQNPVKWLPSQASLMGSGIEVDGERVS